MPISAISAEDDSIALNDDTVELLQIMQDEGNVGGNELHSLTELIEESLPEALSFVARAQSVQCPACQHSNDSLLGDPRGKECECDNCGIKFKISAVAEPEIE